MPTILTAYKRLTHKYKDRWSHLDQWSDTNPLVIKILKGKFFTEWERLQREGKNPDDTYYDHSDGGISCFNVIVKSPKGTSMDSVYRALADNLNYGGCSHDYDCCGCGSGYVSEVRRTGRNEYYVEMSHSYNY